MDHAVILQYMQVLGFPVCASISLGWALWKIGGQLLMKFFDHVDSIGPKLDRVAVSNEAIVEHLQKLPANLVDLVADRVLAKLRDDPGVGCRMTEEQYNHVRRAMGDHR